MRSMAEGPDTSSANTETGTPRTGGSRLVRPALLAIAAVVTVFFTYLAIRDVHFADTWDALKESQYGWLVPSLAVIALAMAIRALRWQLLFTSATRPSFRPTLEAMLIGYLFNNVLPARAGEAVRIVALKQRARVSLAEATSTVVIERLFDLLSLLVMLFVAVPFLPEITWLRAAGVLGAVAAALVLAGAIILAVWRERPLRFVLRPLGRFSRFAGEAGEHLPANVLRGLAAIRDVRLAVIGFALTTVSWLVLSLGFWLLMLGFDFGLSPAAGLLVVIAIGVALVLPSPPAAVGVFEGATVIALAAYGVSESEALSYALVLHAVNFFPFIVAGLIVLRGRPSVRSPSRALYDAAPAEPGSASSPRRT